MKLHPPRQISEFELLDVQTLMAACGGEPDLLEQMCRSFETYVPEHLASVLDAFHDRDAPRLREAAHQLCGLLGEFSTIAGDMAGSLEDLAADFHLDEAHVVVERLRTLVPELVRLTSGLTLDGLLREWRPLSVVSPESPVDR